MSEDKLILVCSNCKRVSCWQGIFYCEEYLTAGTEWIPISHLEQLKLESSDYWKKFDDEMSREWNDFPGGKNDV